MRIGDPARDVAARDSDLVQDTAMSDVMLMLEFTPEHVDETACLVPFLVLTGEERSSQGLHDAPSGGVLL